MSAGKDSIQTGRLDEQSEIFYVSMDELAFFANL